MKLFWFIETVLRPALKSILCIVSIALCTVLYASWQNQAYNIHFDIHSKDKNLSRKI